jgi:hypothetical protein
MSANQRWIEVVVPVGNEESTLEANTELLLGYLLSEFPFRFDDYDRRPRASARPAPGGGYEWTRVALIGDHVARGIHTKP